MDVLATVDIERIGVGERQVIINGDVPDKNVVAAHQMSGPHRRVMQGNILQAYLFAAFKHHQSRAL